MKKVSHKTISVDSQSTLDYIQNNQQAFIDGFIGQYLRIILPIVESKIKDAISQYYRSYTPLLYKRQYSLNGVYKIDSVGKKIIFDSAFLNGVHRANDEYIYQKMFKEGFHGGAPFNGGMYWRWPSKPIGGLGRYSMWYPFGEAPQTQAPFDIIRSDIYSYVNTYGVKLLASLITKEVKKIMKGV